MISSKKMMKVVAKTEAAIANMEEESFRIRNEEKRRSSVNYQDEINKEFNNDV